MEEKYGALQKDEALSSTILRMHLQRGGKIFVDLDIEGKERTAIRITVEPR